MLDNSAKFYFIGCLFIRVLERILLIYCRCLTFKYNNFRTESNDRRSYDLLYGLRSFARPEVISRNDARSCFEWFDNRINQRNSLHHFAGPHLALQSFWAHRENCGNGKQPYQSFKCSLPFLSHLYRGRNMKNPSFFATRGRTGKNLGAETTKVRGRIMKGAETWKF